MLISLLIKTLRRRPTVCWFAGIALACSAALSGQVQVLEPLPPDEHGHAAADSNSNQIRSLSVVAEGEGSVLEVEADDRLGWRSFLDPSGNLVVELDAILQGPHEDEIRAQGLITRVSVSHAAADAELEIPARTRLTVLTAPESAHWIASDGSSLRLRVLPRTEQLDVVTPLTPLDSDGADTHDQVAQIEPAQEAQPPTETPTVESSPQPPPGPPERPQQAELEIPRPILEDQPIQVSYRQEVTATEVQIRGGGSFQFTELVLEDPPRYVVDVAGALIAQQVLIETFDSPVVERIRAAQFRLKPDPVVRVVLDLRQDDAAEIAIRRRNETIHITVPTTAEARPIERSELQASPPDSSNSSLATESSVADLVARWKHAWEQQDVDGYLDCYSQQFQPSNGADRAEWERIRRERLASPEFVELTIENQRIEHTGDSRAIVTFVQSYRSNTFSDVITKTLTLERSRGEWRIIRETTR